MMCLKEPCMGPGTETVFPLHLLRKDQEGSRTHAVWGTGGVSLSKCCSFLSRTRDPLPGTPAFTWKPGEPSPAQFVYRFLFLLLA